MQASGARAAALTLTGGRYNQLRRMFAAAGIHAEDLHRRRFGPLALDGLPEGTWRALTPQEIAV
jgi:16S rRNA pseudouridine516 synthase